MFLIGNYKRDEKKKKRSIFFFFVHLGDGMQYSSRSHMSVLPTGVVNCVQFENRITMF